MSQTIIIGESTWPASDIYMEWTWLRCNGLFTHLQYRSPGGNANFIFFDGHARTMKWAQTVFPIAENQWELQPNPDPNSRKVAGPLGCNFTVPDPWICKKGGTSFPGKEMTRPDQLQ